MMPQDNWTETTECLEPPSLLPYHSRTNFHSPTNFKEILEVWHSIICLIFRPRKSIPPRLSRKTFQYLRECRTDVNMLLSVKYLYSCWEMQFRVITLAHRGCWTQQMMCAIAPLHCLQ